VGALTLACGDRHVGEELAQDTLVRVWERWGEVSRLDSPEAWTFRVGLNLAGSWRRRAAAERRANRRAADTRSVQAQGDEVDGTVRRAVAALPDRQRAVIVARFYLGYDVSGTAELLGCAQGTVKAATHHAMKNLRGCGFLLDPAAEGQRT